MGDKRTIEVLIALLLVFFAVAFVAYLDDKAGTKIFDIGLPGLIENTVVIVFALFCIAAAVFEIFRTEIHDSGNPD